MQIILSKDTANAPVLVAPVSRSTRPGFDRIMGVRVQQASGREVYEMPAYLPLLPRVLHDLRVVFGEEGFALDPRASRYVEAQLARDARRQQGLLPEGWDEALAQSRFPPMHHQREALMRLAYEPRLGVFFDPGLGKTKIVLDMLRALHATGDRQTAAVLVPSGNLVNNWAREAETHHPGIFQVAQMTTASGGMRPAAQRKKLINELVALDPAAGPRLLVTTYGALASDRAEIKALGATTLVCDESHALMTPTSARSQQVLDTFTGTYRRICATGTASQGNPCHLFTQYKLLGPHVVTQDAHGFERRFCVYDVKFRCTRCSYRNSPVQPVGGLPNAIAAPSLCEMCHHDEFQRQQMVIGFTNLGEIAWISNILALRREAANCVNLPPRRFIEVPYPAGADMRRNYNALLDGDYDKMVDVETDEGMVSVKRFESRVLRCQQLLSGFRGETIEVPGEDGEEATMQKVTHVDAKAVEHKMEALLSLVESILAAGKKTIIWYAFHQEGNDIMAGLQAAGIGAVRVDGTVSDAVKRQDQFRQDPGITAYVAQIQTGVGYTLTEATYTIFYGYTLDAKVYRQALERNYRIGQTEPVTVYRLVVPGSLHEQILRVLDTAAESDRAISSAQEDLCLHCPNFVDCWPAGVLPYTSGCVVTSDRKAKMKYKPRKL